MIDTRISRADIWLRVVLVFALLYLFLVGIKALEFSIQSFGSDVVANIFENVSHPVAGLWPASWQRR